MKKNRTITDEDLLAAKRLKQIWDKNKKELSLTQDKAAELLGFSTQATVSHYLTGKLALGVEAVLRFAVLLKVRPEEIRPDMAELFSSIRNLPTSDMNNYYVEKNTLSQKEKLLLDLYNDLPESEAEKIIDVMKSKKKYFEKNHERISI
ncbi:XRE family transcriptional regulator [Candidatus Arsenophonus triatominarum]|uniref:XRE family transcriptional regulator n=1 Tax=Candidatus Arsenophonus triatominarum TaxID=57911 RepID=UPI0007C46F0D|nr:XRE family transcriptional regulator [Candidatus Arsenophonus triatominarum]